MKRTLLLVAVLCLIFGMSTAFAGGKQEATGEGTAVERVAQGNEAPELADMVAAGQLPPLEERLPAEPMVIPVHESIARYRGTWNRLWLGPSDTPGPSRITTERLVYWDDAGQVVAPNIAKDFVVSNDGTTFTFYLREGMKWSDGQPYTSQDIMFWYEDIIMNEELTPAPPAWMMVNGSVVDVTAPDDYTVTFKFAAPYGIFLNYMAGPQGHSAATAPKHYLSKFHPSYTDTDKLSAMAKEDGYDLWYQLFAFKNNVFANPDRPTVSAWRTTKASFEPEMILSRNPYYWKVDPQGNQLPYINEIVHSLVENIEVLNIRIINGQADMQFRHVLPDKLPMLIQNQDRFGYRVLRYLDAFETNMAIGINLNNQDPVLREIVQDDRFRKAMSHAMNRDEINQLAYLGMAEKPKQVVPLEGSYYYTDVAREYEKMYIEYDVDKANALLDEMGLTRWTADGRYRLRPDGNVLALTFEFTAAFGPWARAIELIADYWGQVGVRTEPRALERTLFYERKAALQHDVGAWTGAAGMHPILGPRWYLPYSAESIHAIGYGQWYQTGGRQGEEPTGDLLRVMELYDELKAAVSNEEKRDLFDEILKLNMKHLWVIGTLSSPPLLGVVSENMKNVPEEGVYSWIMHSPKNFLPEQFYFVQ